MTIREKGQEHPVPEFDGTECIETFTPAWNEIPALLENAVRNGDAVDAKVEMVLQLRGILR